jgi:hypothetical protein
MESKDITKSATAIEIDFSKKELLIFAKAMDEGETLSQFVDRAIRNLVSEAHRATSPDEGR